MGYCDGFRETVIVVVMLMTLSKGFQKEGIGKMQHHLCVLWFSVGPRSQMLISDSMLFLFSIFFCGFVYVVPSCLPADIVSEF